MKFIGHKSLIRNFVSITMDVVAIDQLLAQLVHAVSNRLMIIICIQFIAPRIPQVWNLRPQSEISSLAQKILSKVTRMQAPNFLSAGMSKARVAVVMSAT